MSIAALEKRIPEIAAVVLVLILGLALALDHRLRDQTTWIEHTVEVQSALNDYEASVFAAESSQRGFLMSNEESYLDLYRQALSEIPELRDKIRILIADNPTQIENLSKLASDTDMRLAYLAKTIAARKSGDEVAVKNAFASHRGQGVMIKVRALLAQMAEREKQLLAERRVRAAQFATELRAVIALGIALLVAALSFWIVSARKQQRVLAETNASLTISIAVNAASAAQVRQMQKMEAIGQLTGGIAHDFNNMLAIVMGGLDMTKRRMARGDMQVGSLIDGALEGAKRAATLTQRLLAFSRKAPLSPTLTDINGLVHGIEDLLRRTLGETIALEFVLGGGIWTTNVDAGQLEIALINLAINARDAMPKGGRLTVETLNAHLDDAYAARHGEVNAGQYVVLAVTDTGEGMAPEIVERAFDPFFTTKGVGQGTGLGLSQIYGFVKQSGGHVKIYSEPSVGTTVKIYLPRAFGKSVDPTVRELREPVPFGSAEELVLVVEDEAGVRRLTVDALRELGYTVRHAASGEEALRVLEELGSVTLLFTDVVMPGISGRQLADNARRKIPNLKILYTTGYTQNAIVHNGVVDADAELLSKPFTIDQLARKVRKVLA